MSILSKITISQRLFSIIAIVATFFFVIIYFDLMVVKDQMMTDRHEKTQTVVEVAHSMIDKEYARFKAGEITEEEAKQLALAQLEALRYDESNYVWINDTQPTMIMHPIKTELNGKYLGNSEDVNGLKLFVEMVNVVKNDPNKAGIVNYYWPKPGFDEAVAKVSSIKLFKPWNWIVGTGIYIDDVNEVFFELALRQLIVTIIILGILIFLINLTRLSIIKPIYKAGLAMTEIAEGDGDLTQRLMTDGKDEVTVLAKGFNSYTDKLEEIIISLRDLALKLASSAEEFSATSQSNCDRASDQSEETEKVASAMTQMTSTISEIADSTVHFANAAKEVYTNAENGRTKVDEMAHEMSDLSDSMKNTSTAITELNENSKQIGSVLDVIQGIAEQTNLLALNAAIEAARAGEQGRGFAVVADEVRTLASRTQQSTIEIESIIDQLQKRSTQAVGAIEHSRKSSKSISKKSDESKSALEEIVHSISKINDTSDHVASASKEQMSAANEIDSSISNISDMAQTTAMSSKEITVAAHELATLSEQLNELVLRFKVH